MDKDEILIDCFKEALKFSQRSFNVGFVLIILSFLVSQGTVESENVKIPLLNLTISSSKTLLTLLLVLYTLVGCQFLFAVRRACSILARCEKNEWIIAMSHYPAIINSRGIIRIITIFLLYGLNMIILSDGYNLHPIPSFLLSIVIGIPYGFAMKYGKYISVKEYEL